MTFFDQMMTFFAGTGFWTYFVIFAGKITEVTISTMRVMLINRGERVAGTLASIAEITLWIIITGSVLSGFKEDFMKVIVYVAAFAIGNFMGSLLEEKLALGLCSVSVFIPDYEDSRNTVQALRKNGYGVTVMDAQGMHHAKRIVLMMIVKRKTTANVQKIINGTAKNAVITITNISSLKGGYIKRAMARSKVAYLLNNDPPAPEVPEIDQIIPDCEDTQEHNKEDDT